MYTTSYDSVKIKFENKSFLGLQAHYPFKIPNINNEVLVYEEHIQHPTPVKSRKLLSENAVSVN